MLDGNGAVKSVREHHHDGCSWVQKWKIVGSGRPKTTAHKESVLDSMLRDDVGCEECKSIWRKTEPTNGWQPMLYSQGQRTTSNGQWINKLEF